MFLLSCRTSEVRFQNVLNLWFIYLIIKSGNYTTKVIARVIISCKLVVDDVEGIFSHEHIVDVDIVVAHGVFDPVHIRILLQLTEHDPFLLKDFEQVTLHLGCFLEETLTLPDRIIVVLFPIRKVISFIMECTNLSGNPFHDFNVFIVLAVQVDAVLTELGNLGTLLVDVDVCIINMGFGCKSICYTFILSVDEEMSEIMEDDCDCPAHEQYWGLCKHCVAVLLYYLEWRKKERKKLEEKVRNDEEHQELEQLLRAVGVKKGMEEFQGEHKIVRKVVKPTPKAETSPGFSELLSHYVMRDQVAFLPKAKAGQVKLEIHLESQFDDSFRAEFKIGSKKFLVNHARLC